MPEFVKVAVVVLDVVLLLGAIAVLLDKNALRDKSSASPKPYSLARVQLWWWTVLIIAAELWGFWLTQRIIELNQTAVTLLGISGATTIAGRLVDAQQGAAL